MYGALTNLFVASHRLHETLARSEVLAIIVEIVINIVGSEELAVFELSADQRTLHLATSFGLDENRYRKLTLETGLIGSATLVGQALFVDPNKGVVLPAHEEHLTAVIPLRQQHQIVGAIAIFRLLGHKPALTSIDHELLELLSSEAGSALYCCRLHEAEQARRPKAGR
jgi:hypothetical protein